MDISKTTNRLFYEEMRLLTKDTFEAIYRLKRICIDKNIHYIFINDHIGDVIISLGYLRAFRKEKRINNVTIVITEKFKEISRFYSKDYNNVIILPQYDLYRIFLLGATTYGELYLLKKYPNVTFINPADLARLGFNSLKKYPNFDLHKLIKYGCFKLAQDSKFIGINTLAHSQPPGKKTHVKRVLFSDQARTEKGNVTALCEEIVPTLKNLGYELYTNTDSDRKCIKGTKPIFLGLEEIGMFITGGVFIGLRSGLHDLMAYYNCLNIALYCTDEADRSFFSVKMLPNVVSKIQEIYIADDIQKRKKQIIDFIKNSK